MIRHYLCETQVSPPQCALMARPNATGNTAPAFPASTEEFVRGYLTYLSQNGSLPPSPATSSLPPAVAAPTPTPATQGRSFNRLGRGTGGALKAKQLTSQQITAPAIKRKALVDPDPDTPPTSEPIENANPKSVKRLKTSKVSRFN